MLSDVRNFDYVSGPHTGKIVGIWQRDGYGFIKPDYPKREDDIYFQTVSIRRGLHVKIGDRVQYSKWKLNKETAAVVPTKTSSKFAFRAVICGIAPNESAPQSWRTGTRDPRLWMAPRPSSSSSPVPGRWRPHRYQREETPTAPTPVPVRIARGPPVRVGCHNFAARREKELQKITPPLQTLKENASGKEEVDDGGWREGGVAAEMDGGNVIKMAEQGEDATQAGECGREEGGAGGKPITSTAKWGLEMTGKWLVQSTKKALVNSPCRRVTSKYARPVSPLPGFVLESSEPMAIRV